MFFLTLFLTLNLMMYFIKNPLNMGLLILIQTLIICLMMNFLLNYYWLSYILYMIMLGGILILFMYICSIASNKIIQFNINLLLYFITTFTIMMIIINQINWMNLNLMDINMKNFFFYNEMFSMSKIYNNFSFKISIMMIIYLFILLFMVTMFTNSNKGPLRLMSM